MRHLLPALILTLVLGCAAAAQESVLNPVWENSLLPALKEKVIILDSWTVDINKDGRDETVVVTAGAEVSSNTPEKNQLNAYANNGTKLWTYGVDGRIRAALVYDIDNDGRMEFIVSSGQTLNNVQRGTVRIIGSDGKLMRSFDSTAIMYDMDIGDMFGDRYYEIAGGSEKRAYVFRSFGEQVWMTPAKGEPLYNVSVGAVRIDDLDNDKDGEVVVAADKLYFLNRDGKSLAEADLEPDAPIKTKAIKNLIIASLRGGYRDTIAVTESNRIFAVGIDTMTGKDNDDSKKYKLLTEWTYDPACKVNGIISRRGQKQFDSVIVACSSNKVFSLDSNGQVSWTYPLDGEPTDMNTNDVDGDGVDDLLVCTASGSIYALDLNGNFKWKYDAGYPMQKITAGDMNGDGNKEIMVISDRPMVEAFMINGTYTIRRKADTLFYSARDMFLTSKLNEALPVFKEALTIYTTLKDEKRIQDCETYITKINKALDENRRGEADIFYNRAYEQFQVQDYEGALAFLDKAIAGYTQYGNNDGLVKCQLLKMQIEKIMNTPPTITLPSTTTTTTLPPSNNNTQAYVIFGVMVLMALLIVFIKNRSREKERQEDEEEGQDPAAEAWEKGMDQMEKKMEKEWKGAKR